MAASDGARWPTPRGEALLRPTSAQEFPINSLIKVDRLSTPLKCGLSRDIKLGKYPPEIRQSFLNYISQFSII